jgi:hypothetical protein
MKRIAYFTFILCLGCATNPLKGSWIDNRGNRVDFFADMTFRNSGGSAGKYELQDGGKRISMSTFGMNFILDVVQKGQRIELSGSGTEMYLRPVRPDFPQQYTYQHEIRNYLRQVASMISARSLDISMKQLTNSTTEDDQKTEFSCSELSEVSVSMESCQVNLLPDRKYQITASGSNEHITWEASKNSDYCSDCAAFSFNLK